MGAYMTRYFEDISVGETFSKGSRTITGSEIIEFAEKFDPQPMHTDPEVARQTRFGKHFASGWHTVAACHALHVKTDQVQKVAGGYASGVLHLEWHKPVFAGDTLRIEGEIVDTSVVGDNYGHVDTKIQGLNQHDECVITWVVRGGVERKDDTTDPSSQSE